MKKHLVESKTMALARTHFFVVFLLFCGIISVAFYYSEIRNHSNNGPSSNTFVGRNKRRTNLFEEGYVNDNSTQESNQYNDTTGSCHLNFSVADTENAHSFFTRELPKHESINAVYIYLKKAKSDKTDFKETDSRKWNGLQEWIWVKRESKYHSLNLPVDLDSLTFTISKYGTHALTISWTLPINCNSFIEDDLIYDNETENIVKYLWSNVVGNRTNTEICHRNFHRDEHILKVIWLITTVWVGYDFDCYPINSLIKGYIENSPISKYDISNILTFAVGFFCFMHPFLWHILESIQLNKSAELHQYYKDISKVHKPYGIMRALQKICFNTWHETASRTDEQTKYTPIARYIIFLTIIVFSMNLYKLLNIKNELFEEDTYSNFPDVYRFGVPEYKCVPRWFVLGFSVVVYAISNIWIYIVYNQSDDFILCIPKSVWRCKHWYIRVRDVLQRESHGENSENNEWILNSGKKLIYRFTLLFSVHFWRFIFTYSMCSRCGDQNNDGQNNADQKNDGQNNADQNNDGRSIIKTISNYFIYIFCHIPFGIIILFLNIIINILFCSLPALWFVFYIPITLLKCSMEDTSANQKPSKTCKKLKKVLFCEWILWLFYVLTLRVQVGFYIFIVRSFFFTILIGFTGPPHIWNIYIIVMTSLTYFVTYFSQFIDSYNILLKTVFEITAKTDSNTTKTGSTDDGSAATDSGTTETGSTDDENAATDSNTIQTGRMEGHNVESDSIEEHIFNYIVDNCYLVKKRFFVLILKTVLTVIFLSVSLQILHITNNIDNNKNIVNILAYIMIIISPQIVSMLSKNDASDEIGMHMSEITNLHNIIRQQTIRERGKNNKGDAWYREFSSDTATMCKSCTCLSKFFSSGMVGLLTKALFDWSNITCDHTQLLSLANMDDLTSFFKRSGPDRSDSNCNESNEKTLLLRKLY